MNISYLCALYDSRVVSLNDFLCDLEELADLDVSINNVTDTSARLYHEEQYIARHMDVLMPRRNGWRSQRRERTATNPPLPSRLIS